MTDKIEDSSARPGFTPAELRAQKILLSADNPMGAQTPEGQAQPGATQAEIRALDLMGEAMEAGLSLPQAAQIAHSLGPACDALTRLARQAETRASEAEAAAARKPESPSR